MKKIKILSVVLLMLIIITGCNKEQKGNMMKLELNCDVENGYVWQTTVLNSNVIRSEGDEFLYKDQDNVLETKQVIRFRALETGTAEIEIRYINAQKEDKEKDYSIKYLIEVDSDLNIKILSKTGKFYDDEIITPNLYMDYTNNESQVSNN